MNSRALRSCIIFTRRLSRQARRSSNPRFALFGQDVIERYINSCWHGWYTGCSWTRTRSFGFDQSEAREETAECGWEETETETEEE